MTRVPHAAALRGVSKTFAALARRLGIERKGFSLHSCRHFGPPKRSRPSDVRTVAALLGHAAASIMQTVYGHVITVLGSAVA